jgi:uncharacterized membrane protein YbhN (UPF0104 family)
MSAARHWLRWSASALVLLLSAWLLWRQLQALSLAQLQAALLSMPASAFALSAAATAVSFACLAGYELLVTQWLAPGKVPPALAWRTGLVAHALANTLGFHPVTAVALRLRAYGARGIDATLLAKIVAAIGGCVAGGMVSVLAAAGAWSLWLTGRPALLAFFVLAVPAAVVVLKRRRHPASRRPMLPANPAIALALGLLEMSAAVAALAVLLPAGALPEGPAFVVLFVTATLLGTVSHVPGGLGVFEATLLAAAAPHTHAHVLAALLAYRALYNLLPCALAVLTLAVGTMRGRAGREFSSTEGTHA